MCSRIFWGKTTETYCSIWAGVVGFCSLFSLLIGDVSSAMKWGWLREKPSLPQAFITSIPLYSISGVFDFTACHEEVGVFWYLHHQGIQFRHLFFEKKKFLEKIINLRVIKELADLGKIHVNIPKTRCQWVCPKSAGWFKNPTISLKTCGSWTKSHHWGGGGGMALVAILIPLLSSK